MKSKLYVIYDTVSEVFNKPFTEINNGSAIRAFQQSLDENKARKEDYQLYIVAEYTDHDGVITPIKPKRIYSGVEYKVEDLPELKVQNS